MKKKYVYLFVFLCGIFSCKKESKNGFQIDDFPLKVGNHWTFIFTDWSGWQDTARMKVYTQQLLSDGTLKFVCPVSVKYYVYNTVIIYKSKSSLRFTSTYLNPQHFLGETTLNFPLTQDKQWTGIDATDKYTLVSVSDSTINRRYTFRETYYLSRRYKSSTTYINSSFEFNKGIGFSRVSSREDYIADAPNHVNLELIDYYVVK